MGSGTDFERPHKLVEEAAGKHGVRDNKGKPRPALLVPWFILEMAAVMAYGALKYAVNQWKLGLPVSEHMDAAGRHQLRFMMREDREAESKCLHLAHAAVDLMMAAWTSKNRPDLDDRDAE